MNKQCLVETLQDCCQHSEHHNNPNTLVLTAAGGSALIRPNRAGLTPHVHRFGHGTGIIIPPRAYSLVVDCVLQLPIIDIPADDPEVESAIEAYNNSRIEHLEINYARLLATLESTLC